MSNRIRRLGHLPHDVYRAYGEAGQLLYVGISINAFKRLMQHRSERSEWVPYTRRIDIFRYQDRVTAAYMEALAIHSEDPIWNIRPEHRALRHVNVSEPVEIITGMCPEDIWGEAHV